MVVFKVVVLVKNTIKIINKYFVMLFTLVGLARQSSYFLMLVHKKVTKEHDTPYRLFLVLLTLMGGNRELAKSWLKQPLAEVSHQGCATQRGRRGNLAH